MRAVAIALGLAALAAASAHAADAIKAGKWEFSAQVQIPNMPKLPPGVQLPPGINIGRGEIRVTKTSCIDSATPMPAEIRPPSQHHGQCKVANVTVNGGTVTWQTDCTEADGSAIHSEGVAHYTGDAMDATMKTRVSGGNAGPSETTQHITGRYLGACDAK